MAAGALLRDGEQTRGRRAGGGGVVIGLLSTRLGRVRRRPENWKTALSAGVLLRGEPDPGGRALATARAKSARQTVTWQS